MFLKMPQFCSLFWFTQNQADIISAFFALGFLVGAQGLNFLVVAFMSSYRLVQLILVLIYLAAITSLDFTANLGLVSVMCTLVGVMGLILSLLLS